MANYLKPSKKNVWKFGLIHFAIFLAILGVLDFVTGRLLEHFYYSMKSGVQYRTTYAIEETKADVVVFGSSRAVNHYKPEIFEDRLNLSFYNAGRYGEESSLYHYGVLKGMIKRYTPKIVILDLMEGELGNSLYSYDRLASLTPYYNKHPEMRSVIELRSNNEKVKMLSGIYPFNSLLLSILSGTLDKKGKKNKDTKGYLPFPASTIISKPLLTRNNTMEYKLDSIRIKILASFINDCIRKKIKLYIVCSPYYEKASGSDFSIKYIKLMAAKYGVPFLDFSHESYFLKSPKLFGNSLHLNDSGAQLFSKIVADSIRLIERKL
jgi:hypothetical protein